jgi:hypothetical protein
MVLRSQFRGSCYRASQVLRSAAGCLLLRMAVLRDFGGASHRSSPINVASAAAPAVLMQPTALAQRSVERLLLS